MKKILILGASNLQLPAIIKAKECGYYTLVADYNENAIGVKYADEFYNVSTIDIDRIVELAKETHPDGIMTLATDMPMRSIAAATTALGLPGISMDTAIKATDKGEMIKAFQQHKVAIPWFYIINNKEHLCDVLTHIKYPCVMKPTDNAGNRGVCFVKNEYELLSNYSYSVENSRSGQVIIEEYLEGNEVSVEILAINGKVNILAVTDKLTMGPPFFVEIGHSQPSQLPAKDIQKIKNLAIKAIKAIGLDNSPAHVEIMQTKDGPKMIELGARMGGGFITTHLVPLSTGIDMVKAVIDLCLGFSPDITPKLNTGSAIRHIVGLPNGRILSISGIENVSTMPGVREVGMLKEVGNKVCAYKNGSDRVGYVISQADTASNAINICTSALQHINIIVK